MHTSDTPARPAYHGSLPPPLTLGAGPLLSTRAQKAFVIDRSAPVLSSLARLTILLTMTLLLSSTGSVVAASEHGGESARGTIKIEETEFGDSDNPNEVKVGCDFALEFYGFDKGRVPVTFRLQPPSGTRVIESRIAYVDRARGNRLSGTLRVDLTRELAGVAPAQAADYDYKVRVDAEVKSSEGNDSITKSAMLFITCDEAALLPAGGVKAGLGGAVGEPSGTPTWTLLAGLVAAVMVLAGARLKRRGGI